MPKPTWTRCLAPELAGLDREEVRRWYNGYNWTGEAVYNPFGLLLLFRNREFKPYWFETGTPTFLIKLLSERQPLRWANFMNMAAKFHFGHPD